MKPSFGDRTIRARSEALVLVVAPDPELREQLVDVLRSKEVGVLGARGSKDTMAVLDRYPIEVAIIDAQLSEMSGFDLAKSIRRTHGERIALIIITDVKWSQSQKAAATQQMGLLDLLVKPVDPVAVAERVIEALDANSSSLGRRAAGDTLVDDEAATQQTPKPMDTIADEPLAIHDARRTIADEENTEATVPRPPNLSEDEDEEVPDEPATIRATPATLDDDLPTEPYGDDDLPTEPKGQDDPDTQRAHFRSWPQGQASERAEQDATDVGPPPVDLLVDKATRSEKKAVERATRAAQAGPVEFRGNLTSTPFPRLLNRLYQRRDTGALFMLSGRIKKIVYFKEGHPCYIKSNRLSECLGKVLVREEMINEVQCRESLQRMKESHRQQGTVLIDMGVISPHDLVVGLELQLRAKLMDVFTWTRGEFLFKSDARVPSEVIRLDVSNATLIADGVRKTWGERRLKGALQPYMERYIASNPDPELRFQELSLEPEEQALLDSIDGTRTLRELLASSPLPTRRAMGVAYVLLVTGVVQSQRKRPEHARPMAREIAAPVVQPSTASEASVRERLAGQLLFWQKQNAFGVLGVSKESTDAEVKQAYASLAREYHVDRFRHFSADTRRIAQECFTLITKAHEQIGQLEQRKLYQHRITHELKVGTSAGSDALEAERYKKQASSLMERKEWAEARQLLAKAVDLCRDAGDLRALLAWATYSSDTENASLVRTAIRELRKSIELDPKLYQAYLYLGRIYAGMGKTILAEKQFEKALQCNPDCGEALNELKIQKERRPPRRYRF